MGEMPSKYVYTDEHSKNINMKIVSFIAKGWCIGSVIYGIRYGLPWYAILISFILGAIVYGLFEDEL